MKVTEHHPDRLSICYRQSLWWALAIGLTFIPGGILFLILGLAIRETDNVSILSIGIGLVLLVAGIYFGSWAEIITYTFDKTKSSFSIERRTIANLFRTSSLEIPIKAISEVGISNFIADEGNDYFGIFLILSPVQWRINIRSRSDFQSAAQTAKIIASFLDLPCAIDKLKPLNLPNTDNLTGGEPWQFSWQLLQSQVERLEKIVAEQPTDPTTYQQLGIALYYANPRQNRQHAIAYLKKATELFTSQHQPDLAATNQAIQTLISWRY
jgi:hypothetical protein